VTSAVQAAEQLCGMLSGSLSVPSKFPRTGYAGSLGPRITAPGSSVNSEGVTAAFPCLSGSTLYCMQQSSLGIKRYEPSISF
jgi:hypothetical protein